MSPATATALPDFVPLALLCPVTDAWLQVSTRGVPEAKLVSNPLWSVSTKSSVWYFQLGPRSAQLVVSV